MPNSESLQKTLDAAHVEPSVFELRPDYRTVLIAVDGLVLGPSDDASNALLEQAEASAQAAFQGQKVEHLPHVAAWREAYQAFEAKPNRTRNSLEALVRRADAGLPRVNRLTDLYNAVSVLHQIPLGGEDLARYSGAPRLIRATGREPFDTVASGTPQIEYPEQREVVWCDDEGVTCRRWNWSQGRRTQLRSPVHPRRPRGNDHGSTPCRRCRPHNAPRPAGPRSPHSPAPYWGERCSPATTLTGQRAVA